ncbi:hypothetical protein JSE7799_00573 [Jannaschia seosinensis]|uniref:Uncharacterized protein n=1 Tax=Jannaschia seosinensis TaxID=313367 RepID=A0A0M7B7S1_9RHOB|nr:hypothetical protein JSE7799_00573 [Jannaschia seosinensis]
MPGEERVFPVQSDRADEVFDAVGVDLDAPIPKEGLQSVPVVVDVGELLAETRFGGDTQALLLQPFAKGGDKRRRSCLPSREPLTGSHAADLSLDLVELGNAAQAFGRDLGAVAIEHFLQLAPGVRPAIRHADRLTAFAGGARQAVVACVSVDLQDAVEAGQELLRVLPAPAGGVEVDHAGWIVAVPRSIIPGQCPKEAGLGPAAPRVEDGCGGLVHEQLGRRLQVLCQASHHRPQVECRDADPVSQRAAMDVDARAAEDLALAI